MPGGIDLEEPFGGLTDTGGRRALPQSPLRLALAAPVTLPAPLMLAAVAAAMGMPPTLASAMAPVGTLAVASPMGVLPPLSLGVAGLMAGIEVGRGTAPPVRIGGSSLVACGPPGTILH